MEFSIGDTVILKFKEKNHKSFISFVFDKRNGSGNYIEQYRVFVFQLPIFVLERSIKLTRMVLTEKTLKWGRENLT